MEGIKLDGTKSAGAALAGTHFLKLTDVIQEPGIYSVTVRVQDKPMIRKKGLEIPWVLKDDRKLLEERRRWIVTVKE